jgi:hypothetical protein
VLKKKGDVGVIEELNMFGLKEMFSLEVNDLTKKMMKKNYQDACDFAMEKLSRWTYGLWGMMC